MSVKTRPPAAPPEGDLLANLGLPPAPPIPEAFVPCGFGDRAADAWSLGLAELKADGADHSGADKGYRSVRRLAWAWALLGDAVAGWTQRLTRAEERGATNPKAAAEAARLRELIDAARTWGGESLASATATASAAMLRVGSARDRIAFLTELKVLIPVSLDGELLSLDGELLEAQREATRAAAEEVSVRQAFNALLTMKTEAEAAARQALAGSLGNLAAALGGRVAGIVNDAGVELLKMFPDRGPRQLDELFRHALRINEIAIQLGAGGDEALLRFWHSCGADAARIVGVRNDVVPPVFRDEEGGEKRRAPSMDTLRAAP